MELPYEHKNKGAIQKQISHLKKIFSQNSRQKITTGIMTYIQENKWESIAILMGILAFGLSTIGFYQMFEENKLTARVIDSIYNTFRVFLFDMERPDPDTPIPWTLEIARWIAPFVTSFYAGKAILYVFKNQIALLTLDQGHIIICGAGEKGRTLGMEWLEKIKYATEDSEFYGKKLFYIESDPNCSNIETLQEAGAIVLQGKAQEKLILEKLKVDTAEYFITTTDHDTTNMEIISTLLNMKSMQQRETKLKCYVHLLHSEFYDFFMAKKFSEQETMLDIKIFNLYSNSARMLFKDRVLGDNVFHDTSTIKETSTKVKLAILGFGKLAENVLVHALHLGHFYNGQPIEVTVVYDQDKDENANLLDEFTKQYDILNEEYNGKYWNVKFIDDGAFGDTNMDFTQIIVAYENEFESLSNLMKILKKYNDKIIDNKIDIAIYSNSFKNTANIIQHDQNEKYQDQHTVFKYVRTFGEIDKTCSYDMVVNQELDVMAKLNDEHYNKLHGYCVGLSTPELTKFKEDVKKENVSKDEMKVKIKAFCKEKYGHEDCCERIRKEINYKAFDNLDMFLKDSNRYLIEHNQIKKFLISKFIDKRENINTFEDIKSSIEKKYFNYDGMKINWKEMELENHDYALKLREEEIVKLAKVEHTRWNAFHILNGWKKLEIPEGTTKKIEKDKVRKLHPCIVSWEELDRVSKNHNHDYKSDDIETIMRIPSLDKILEK